MAACTSNVSLGQAPGASTGGQGQNGNGQNGNPGDGSSVTGPYGITCEAYFRPAFTSQQQSFTVRSDASGGQSLGFETTTVDFSFQPAADNADEAELTVKVPYVRSTQVFRLSKTRRPVAQLAGGHGFTGLVYAGPDIQFLCKADGETPPASQATKALMDVFCQVELRSAPGGAVEERARFEYKGGEPTNQTGTYGGMGFTFAGYDSELEGRSVVVGLTDTVQGPLGGERIRQLFQFDPKAPIVNQLAGTTISGKAAITNAAGRELSYACSSREVDPNDAIVDVKKCADTATNTCSNACGAGEVCFTQVSCGPAGNPSCTLGDFAPADDGCHKSCVQDADCDGPQQCVKKTFFGCSDFNAERGICCAKGTNCEKLLR